MLTARELIAALGRYDGDADVSFHTRDRVFSVDLAMANGPEVMLSYGDCDPDCVSCSAGDHDECGVDCHDDL